MKLIIALSFLYSTFAVASPYSEKLDSIRNFYKMPGMVTAYYLDGHFEEGSASGVRKAGDKTPITIKDKFHLGSITKSMTATLLGTFIEDGKVSWTSTLGELFPEYKIHPKFREVTLEMVLAHRAGLDRGLNRFQARIDELKKTIDISKISDERGLIISAILESPPEFEPGSVFSYSNNGYVIIGHVLERIAGKSWETIIQDRLFQPLDMKGCGFGSPVNPDSRLPNQPWGHIFDASGNLQSTDQDNFPLWGPAGTVHCTLEALNKYFMMHINGFNGVGSIVRPETFEKLHTSYPDQTYTYGGWVRLERQWADGTVLTHSGTNEMNMANVWLAPKKQASYFGFANMGGDPAASAIDDALVALIYRGK